MNEELINEFADFYADMGDIYGDNEAGLEEAYADFTSALGLDTQEVVSNEETYSQEDLENEFVNYYAEMIEVYGDSEAGVEEAYADFAEALGLDTNVEEENYSDVDEAFVNYYAEMLDVYGDSEAGLEEAYADFYAEQAEPGFMQKSKDFVKDNKMAMAGTTLGVAGGAAAVGKLPKVKEWKNRLAYLKGLERHSEAEIKEMKVLKGKIIGARVAGAGVLGTAAGFAGHKLDTKHSDDEYSKGEPKSQKSMDRRLSTVAGAAAGYGLGGVVGQLAPTKSDFTGEEATRFSELAFLLKSGKATPAEKKEYAKLSLQANKRLQAKSKNATIGNAVGTVAGAVVGNQIGKYSDEDEYASGEANLKAAHTAGGAVIGAVAGAIKGNRMTVAQADRLKHLKKLQNINRISPAENKELAELIAFKKEDNARMLKTAGAGAAIGGAAGYGAAHYISKATQHSDVEAQMESDFADFYADNADNYGDDVSIAFDDFADLYMDLKGFGDKAKKFAGTTKGKAAIGSVAGLVTGAVAAHVTDGNKNRRNVLKAKAKQGDITATEKAELDTLIQKRRQRMIAGAGVGTAVGATAGTLSSKDAREKATGWFKKSDTKKVEDKKEDKTAEKATDIVKSAEDKNVEGTDKVFSAMKDQPGKSYIKHLIIG